MMESLQIKALDEDGDVRALDADGKPVKPGTVQSYLGRAFKSRLSDAERALKVSSWSSVMLQASSAPWGRDVCKMSSVRGLRNVLNYSTDLSMVVLSMHGSLLQLCASP